MRCVLILLACAGSSPSPVAPEEQLAGGWADADPGTDEVRTAQEQVQDLLRARTGDDTLTIRAVTSAKAQVVAGMNYALVLDLTGADGDKTGVTVVAYRDLQRQWALTSVEGL